jgi:hypothetical protein
MSAGMNGRWVGCAAALAVVSLAQSARALGPVDVEVAAEGGWATNGLTADVGGRAGISVIGIYVGFVGVYYVGKTGSPVGQLPPLPPSGATQRYHQLAFGGELGYGFKLGPVTLRPFVGFGRTTTYGSYPDLSTDTAGQPYFEAGGLVQLTFGHLIFGVDGRAFSPTTEGSETGFVLDGEVGVTF